MIGKFVTAKLKNDISSRQGWVINTNPLIIVGQTGTIYECEDKYPTNVWEPPTVSEDPTETMFNINWADLFRKILLNNSFETLQRLKTLTIKEE